MHAAISGCDGDCDSDCGCYLGSTSTIVIVLDEMAFVLRHNGYGAVPSAAIVVFKLKNMQINIHKVGKIVWPTTRVRLSGLVLFTLSLDWLELRRLELHWLGLT